MNPLDLNDDCLKCIGKYVKLLREREEQKQKDFLETENALLSAFKNNYLDVGKILYDKLYKCGYDYCYYEQYFDEDKIKEIKTFLRT